MYCEHCPRDGGMCIVCDGVEPGMRRQAVYTAVLTAVTVVVVAVLVVLAAGG